MALTTLENVREHLVITSDSDDALLTRMINQISQAILGYLQRPSLTRATYTELRNGVGNYVMTLRNWPVVSVASLVINNLTVPQAAAMQAGTPGTTYTPSTPNTGWTLQTWDGASAGVPQQLSLYGYCYNRGANNVQITYDAGYCVTSQAFTVPASAPYTTSILPVYGAWAQDDGVYYASNNTKLTKMPVGTSLSAGQYTVTVDGLGQGSYTFASADAGVGLLLNYSYTPAPLEQACIEWVGERYRYKTRIGQTSKNVGGQETAAFSLKAIPDFIAEILEPYRKDFPL